jgi:hypothetical protein
MAETSEKTSVSEALRAAGKDVVVGLAIGLAVYVVWVIGHSILFGMGG